MRNTPEHAARVHDRMAAKGCNVPPRRPADRPPPGGPPAARVRLPLPQCVWLGPALPNQTCGCGQKLRKCGWFGENCTTGPSAAPHVCRADCEGYEAKPA